MALQFDDMEAVYDRLAEAIDAAGEEHAALFLTKLALVLAQELENREQALDAINACLAHLKRDQG